MADAPFDRREFLAGVGVTALDVVKASKQIVQVGTQRRSSPRFQEAKRYIDSGALGAITKIETAWNRNVPSWARPVDMVKAEDVDWQQYQMYLPKRAFDASRARRWHWIDCVRSRQTPNAPIEAGFAHAVACCMGREAERTGQRVRYDAKTRRIVTTT